MAGRPAKVHLKRSHHRGTKAHEVGVDGVEFLSRNQAAAALCITEKTLRLWHERGILVPAERRRGVWVYQREQIENHRREMPGELAALAFQAFEQGESPVQVVIRLRCDPAPISALHDSWVRLTGAWVIAGPAAGSRQSWEATYRLGELTPVKLRRALELCASDARLRARLLGEVAKESGEATSAGARAVELVGDSAKDGSELE